VRGGGVPAGVTRPGGSAGSERPRGHRPDQRLREEVLVPEGLEGLETYWVHRSRVDGVAGVVHFRDPEQLEGPQWHYLSPAEFQKVLTAFEAPDQMEEWIREGELDVERWEESAQIHRSDRKPN